MGKRKRVTAAVLAALFLAAELALSAGTATGPAQEAASAFRVRDTLYFWYTDEALTDYLNSAALEYYEETGYRIVPTLHSGLEYLEEINRASLSGEEMPDLYLLTNDALEKAYLAGLAAPASGTALFDDTSVFCQTAQDAVTYHDRILGYPFCFETGFLLYNRTYLLDAARRQLEAEADARAGEEAMEELERQGAEDGSPEAEDGSAASAPQGDAASQRDGSAASAPQENGSAASASQADAASQRNGSAASASQKDVASQEDAAIQSGGDASSSTQGGEGETGGAPFSDAEVSRLQETLVPATMEELLAFSDTYDAPENVEAIFRWDVSDIFFNYFFAGQYMKAGGACGDDPGMVEVDNSQVAACMRTYQELNQFFSIDAKEISYEQIMQEFMEGKLLFTVATTDAAARLEAAREDGSFPYEYGAAPLPDIDGTLKTRSLSVTNAVVVNGYSEKQEIANDFAAYLTTQKADALYAQTGKLSAREGTAQGSPAREVCMEAYRASVPLPKLLEISNFWVELEIAFTQIWGGADITETLRDLQAQMDEQLSGQEAGAQP